jgi:hypothetical protein
MSEETFAPVPAERVETGEITIPKPRRDPWWWHLLTLAPFALCVGAFAYYLSLGAP